MNNGESIYISLSEAAQYCDYSQEYLSLRARQGKLKSIKFGRNWVTKKEWLEEYLKKVEEYNNNLGIKTIVAPPENLPVESVEVRPQPMPALRFGFIVVLVFVSLITGIFHGRESFTNTYQALTPLVVKFNENFDKEIVNMVQIVGGAGDIIVGPPTKIIFKTVSEIPQSFDFVFGEFNENFDSHFTTLASEINYQFTTLSYQAAGIGEIATETIKGYFQWLVKSYLAANDTLEKNLAEDIDNLVTGFKYLTSGVKQLVLNARDWAWEGWQFVFRPWREVPVAEEPLRPKPEEGAIVVPSPPEAELAEMKGKLEQAFSDKVEVKPDVTGRAGIIKPLIKEAEAQEYLYLIVPVTENEK